MTTRRDRLEKKIDLLSRAMHLLLFEKKEKTSRKETREIEERLSAYLQDDRSEFTSLEDVLLNVECKNTKP